MRLKWDWNETEMRLKWDWNETQMRQKPIFSPSVLAEPVKCGLEKSCFRFFLGGSGISVTEKRRKNVNFTKNPQFFTIFSYLNGPPNVCNWEFSEFVFLEAWVPFYFLVLTSYCRIFSNIWCLPSQDLKKKERKEIISRKKSQKKTDSQSGK